LATISWTLTPHVPQNLLPSDKGVPQVQVAIGLVFYGLDHPGMAVTGITDTDPADEIEVFFTVAVKQAEAFGLYDLPAFGARQK